MFRKLTFVSSGVGLVAFVVLLVGCGSSPSTSPTTSSGTTTSAGSVSFKNTVQPILTSNCVVCHQGGSPPGGLSLEPSVAYGSLVNKPSSESPEMRVSPGAPDKSYLVNKLEGTQNQAGGSGAQMPYGASPLPGSQIDLVKQWISAGAPNN
jgi:hypothetical protein